MKDADLRRCLLQQLRPAPGVLRVVEELGLHHGQSRADIVAVTAAGLHGYELKSERDTLQRLSTQSYWYGRVLCRCTLVAADVHLAGAFEVVPSWWGVQRALATPDGLVLEQVREALRNPEQQPLDMARLLWRDEALALLRECGEAKCLSRLSKLKLYQRLLATLSVDELRAAVVRTLQHRQRPDSMWR